MVCRGSHKRFESAVAGGLGRVVFPAVFVGVVVSGVVLVGDMFCEVLFSGVGLAEDMFCGVDREYEEVVGMRGRFARGVGSRGFGLYR